MLFSICRNVDFVPEETSEKVEETGDKLKYCVNNDFEQVSIWVPI